MIRVDRFKIYLGNVVNILEVEAVLELTFGSIAELGSVYISKVSGG